MRRSRLTILDIPCQPDVGAAGAILVARHD
jgi:hypothetical protein